MKVNVCGHLLSNHLIAFLVFPVLCVCFMASCTGPRNDSITSISTRGRDFKRDSANTKTDDHGPTLIMAYSSGNSVQNPVSSFMYFVPLIIPTLVDTVSSVDNQQKASIISHTIKVDSDSLYVLCEFEIAGSGFYLNTFDPSGMIADSADAVDKNKTLTNLLDYLKLEGEGYGMVEVKGQITDSTRIVTEVSLHFNARGHASPLTIGLYDIKPKEDEYQYVNRSNEIVAQVNTLTFKRTEQVPRMGVQIASITNKNESAGFWGGVKGAIANLLITPPKIDILGNTTMLEFGAALLEKKTTFTFPKAYNLRESKTEDSTLLSN